MSFAASAAHADAARPAELTDGAIAAQTHSGGLMPSYSSLRVYPTGEVVYLHSFGFGGPLKREVLAKLSIEKIGQFQKKLVDIKTGELVDPEKDKPFCMDAPEGRVVIKQGAKELVIRRYSGCHTIANPNDYDSTVIAGILDALNALNTLSP